MNLQALSTFKESQAIHLLSSKNMPKLAHLMISTLELAALICFNAKNLQFNASTDHHSASPPRTKPPPSGHQEEAGPKAFLSLQLMGSHASKFSVTGEPKKTQAQQKPAVLKFENQNRVLPFSFLNSRDFERPSIFGVSSQKILTSSFGSDLETLLVSSWLFPKKGL